jgi:diphosphomevalonate decarboxylase
MTTSTRAKRAAEQAWPSGKRRASARARANFALIKYWGKADARLNVPAVGSISITLDALWSDTDVELDPSLAPTSSCSTVSAAPSSSTRCPRVLDILRERAGVRTRARVGARTTFRPAPGLASSASGSRRS